MVARKCQCSCNSSHAFFQFIWLKRVVAWLENHAKTSLKSCGANNVHATTSLFPKLLAWKELWCRHYPRHDFLKKLWRGFLVTPQLFSLRWIGRRLALTGHHNNELLIVISDVLTVVTSRQPQRRTACCALNLLLQILLNCCLCHLASKY